MLVSGWRVFTILKGYHDDKAVYDKISEQAGDDIDFDALRKINPDVIGWLRYEELAGEYTLSFDNPAKTVDIVLTPNVYRESYKLTGLNPLITLNVEYNVAAGNLNLFGQTIGTEGNYTVWWSPWSRVGGGSLWFNTSYGMKTVLDQASYEADPAHFTLNWVTGPCSTGKPVDSFIIYMREGSTSKGTAPARWNIPGTTARLPYLHSITKK